MALKINRNEAEKIVSIKTADGVFSYSYLMNPRPESDFQPGTYGTEFIIRDKATLAAIKGYIKDVIKEAAAGDWSGKVPRDLHIPLKAGDSENPLEADAFVLKTSTKNQPKVYIRNAKGRAFEVEEDEIDEIYSGMIGELIFTLRAYKYNGKKGITAYVNAVCKTGAGTPLGGKSDYESDFSLEGSFDEDDEDEESEEEETVVAPTKKLTPAEKTKATKAKNKAAKAAKKEAEFDVDSLISGGEESDDEESEVDTSNMSIDDFLNIS